uniref:hypothetical protein n=1 Tax=Pedobacter schmidteae TaxID=2201271 RepID=UPI000EB3994C|nr:hypothetical protein [Pedobacter schmidteae]
MLKILQGLMKLNTLTGVEVHTDKDGQRLINACTIRITKHQLSFENKHKGLKSVLHFAKNFKAGPVAIILNGKGIITKKIDKVTAIDQQTVNQILPNANPEQFYFQHHISGDHSIISAIRRVDADDLISQFQQEGFTVMSLSLGAFALENVMELKKGELEPELLPAYGAAFQVLLSDEPTEVAHQQLIACRLQFFAKTKLQGIGMLTGVAMLILLLINFALISYYTGQVQALSAVSHVTATEIGKLKGQETDISKKTALIKAAGWTGGLNYAYIADQLLACMPLKMSLQELSINPLDEQQSRNKHENIYLTKMVKLSGSCMDASMLNNWIFALKSKDWVAGCKILNYSINQDDGMGSFAISVELKDHEE